MAGARHAFCLAAAFLALAACTVVPVDLPLKPAQQNVDRRSVDFAAEHPMVVLSFSGGGSRATALAAAVTARLDQITYPTPAGPRRLSQDVAVVSSVSGGSVFAAWIGLYGLDHDKVTAFERKVGTFDGIGYLAGRAFNPLTWADLALSGRTRVDVLQDMLGLFLETNATMATLNQKGKPVVVLNASDMTSGEVFSFMPFVLDDMCLSFDDLPVVVAVSASAAVPVAFSPVMLKNESWSGCRGAQTPAGDWRTLLSADGGAYTNIEAFRWARYRASLRHDPLAYRQAEYVRLLDGGLADNLGLTAARRMLLDTDSPAYALSALSDGTLKKLVVISVNARSDVRNPLDTSDARTSILDMIGAVTDVPIDATTANVAAAFRGFVANLANNRTTLLNLGMKKANFTIYPVEIDFDELPAGTQDERDTRDRVKSIATSWTISPDEVSLIDKVAGTLLWRHPCFRALMADLKATGTPEASPPPNIACPQQ
ncbi:MAG TPA: patatin-like phospholipase family protein [Stellaceae bacterium]|nr:patatin-like phospholipase family protein [Stellaceae bacterium]